MLTGGTWRRVLSIIACDLHSQQNSAFWFFHPNSEPFWWSVCLYLPTNHQSLPFQERLKQQYTWSLRASLSYYSISGSLQESQWFSLRSEPLLLVTLWDRALKTFWHHLYCKSLLVFYWKFFWYAWIPSQLHSHLLNLDLWNSQTLQWSLVISTASRKFTV